MRIAPAMRSAPLGPKIVSATAVPTRSWVAWLMPRATAVAPSVDPAYGNTLRYEKLVRMYSSETSPVPYTSASGRLRAGFFTSAAAKVTLFHASLENREPTMAAPKAMTSVDVRDH